MSQQGRLANAGAAANRHNLITGSSASIETTINLPQLVHVTLTADEAKARVVAVVAGPKLLRGRDKGSARS